jgi:ferrous iron transport protein B
VLGAPLQDLLDQGIQWLAGVVDGGMEKWGVSDAVRSLVVDGVFGGVGTVVSFVPIIIILFFFLSMLEDSGYMARVAFVTDKLLRRLGLSGRSIVPLLIGFGCSVPAVMATRTLP